MTRKAIELSDPYRASAIELVALRPRKRTLRGKLHRIKRRLILRWANWNPDWTYVFRNVTKYFDSTIVSNIVSIESLLHKGSKLERQIYFSIDGGRSWRTIDGTHADQRMRDRLAIHYYDWKSNEEFRKTLESANIVSEPKLDINLKRLEMLEDFAQRNYRQVVADIMRLEQEQDSLHHAHSKLESRLTNTKDK